jgi:hypothetical protein
VSEADFQALLRERGREIGPKPVEKLKAMRA